MADGRRSAITEAYIADEQLVRQAVVAGVVSSDLAAQATTPRPEGPPPLEFLIERKVLTREQVDLLRMLTRRDEGSRTIGSYQLLDVIGKGGMGVVYRAVHAVLERQAAVKVLLPLLAEDLNFQERFLREAKAAAGINHPNVVQCYDAGREGGRLFLAMELLPRGDAESLMTKHGGSLPERVALEICRDAACGLEAIAEAGLVHRDLKPANLLLAVDGSAKIGDLGLARPLQRVGRITQHGTIAGTPAYMAPEQVRGDDKLDIRADIYALAATLFCLLTGTPPLTGSPGAMIAEALAGHQVPDPRCVARGISDATAAIIERAGAPLIKHRYQNPRDLRIALESALGERPTSPTRRTRAVAAAAVQPTVILGGRSRDVLLVTDASHKTDAYARLVPPAVRVRSANTVESAEAEIRRLAPAAVIIDVAEAQVAEQLRERLRPDPRFSNLPIIDVASLIPADASEPSSDDLGGVEGRSAILALNALAPLWDNDPMARATPATHRLDPLDALRAGTRSRSLELIAQAASWAAELRSTAAAESAAQIKVIADTLRSVVVAAAASRSDVGLLAETTEAFLRHLHLWPEHITPSAIRTVHQAIARIERLLKEGPARPVASLHALAVDDDPISLQAMQLAMQKVGISSLITTDGSEALTLAARAPFDLVLSDVLMPSMDGYEFAQRLRRLAGYERTPVIFVTSLESAAQTLRAGIQMSNDVIIKPFLFMELATKALAHCLGSSELPT